MLNAISWQSLVIYNKYILSYKHANCSDLIQLIAMMLVLVSKCTWDILATGLDLKVDF